MPEGSGHCSLRTSARTSIFGAFRQVQDDHHHLSIPILWGKVVAGLLLSKKTSGQFTGTPWGSPDEVLGCSNASLVRAPFMSTSCSCLLPIGGADPEAAQGRGGTCQWLRLLFSPICL